MSQEQIENIANSLQDFNADKGFDCTDCSLCDAGMLEIAKHLVNEAKLYEGYVKKEDAPKYCEINGKRIRKIVNFGQADGWDTEDMISVQELDKNMIVLKPEHKEG